MAVIWNTSCKKMISLSKRHQMFFLIVVISASKTSNLFIEFLVSVINHYHINGLHLFWHSFEWFCLEISSDAKYFFLFCPRHCDRGLIIVIAYYQIWNKKKNTLLSVEFLVVTRVPCILRHPIFFHTCFANVQEKTSIKWTKMCLNYSTCIFILPNQRCLWKERRLTRKKSEQSTTSVWSRETTIEQ